MKAQSGDHVTILTSGVALGVYVPGVMIEVQLRARGIPCTVEVLENLLPAAKRDGIAATKVAFHRNFKAALIGQKMVRDLRPGLDPECVARLLAAWKSERRRRFVVFSGFWLPILEEYLEEGADAGSVAVDLCHLDAMASPSWKPYRIPEAFRQVWFFDASEQAVPRALRVTAEPPVPWQDREPRCLIHGGGWGMGTYRSELAELEEHGVALDVVAYEARDLEDRGAAHRYYLIDPEWQPWHRDAGGRHRFPPFGEVSAGGGTRFQQSRSFPDHHRLVRRDQAVISKPGGGTLVDSLAAATPLLMLEPFGEHERRNARLWHRLGFGIPLEEWIGAGCSRQLLADLHQGLLAARPSIPDYVEELADAAAN